MFVHKHLLAFDSNSSGCSSVISAAADTQVPIQFNVLLIVYYFPY